VLILADHQFSQARTPDSQLTHLSKRSYIRHHSVFSST